MVYEIIRSNRKTISLQIKGGNLIVRAPVRATKKEIDAFVKKHEGWISKHLAETRKRLATAEAAGKLSPEEVKALMDRARKVIPERVRHYAPLVGVDYGRITIRSQRTRWGSCSSKGNLNFNCLLMLAPQEVLDSVVVHELCHRKEMNHSDRFYREVLKVFPEYKKWDKWLKDHGPELVNRLQSREG